MKNKLLKQEGNIVVIAMIFIGIALIIFIFVIAIFMGNINSILYGVKTDMYTINKSAVISVNKNQANVDNFKYNEKAYKKSFIELLKKNYDLDNNLENKNGLISKISIEEYKIYKKGQSDKFTKEKNDDTVIHTVLKVKVKPIILRTILEEIFVFTIHEDVNLNMAKNEKIIN